MASTKEIHRKILSISSTQQITKAMKMVAASKLNKVQARIIGMKAYSSLMYSIMERISVAGRANVTDNLFFEQRKIERVLLVVIASDKGLCGAYNANILKNTNAVINKIIREHPAVEISILPIGDRADAFFAKKNFRMVNGFSNALNILSFNSSKSIVQFLIKEFLVKNYDKIMLSYSSFKSIAKQEPVIVDYLPIANLLDGYDGCDGGYLDYIYEPCKVDILQTLIPKLLEVKVYSSLIESSASEHSARMMTMSKAYDNAGDMLKVLKVSYNRTRQAAITQEISEIVSGAQALLQ